MACARCIGQPVPSSAAACHTLNVSGHAEGYFKGKFLVQTLHQWGQHIWMSEPLWLCCGKSFIRVSCFRGLEIRHDLICFLFFGSSGPDKHSCFSLFARVSLMKMHWCLKRCHLVKSSAHSQIPPLSQPPSEFRPRAWKGASIMQSSLWAWNEAALLLLYQRNCFKCLNLMNEMNLHVSRVFIAVCLY